MKQPHQYQGRITGIKDVLPDTRILKVTIDKQLFSFKAGQYILLSFPGVEPRPFSIASPGSPELEFHVKNSGRGIDTRVFADLKPGCAMSGPGLKLDQSLSLLRLSATIND